MSPENSQQADQNVRSKWNANQEYSEPAVDPMEKVMGGPSMFDEGDDDYLEPGETAEPDEMDEMMAQYLDQMPGEVNQGQLLTVPVVAIKSDHVLVDVGDKSEGIVNIKEFPMIGDKLTIKVGDMIDVVVKGPDPDSGLINLSYQEARRRKALQEVEAAIRNHTAIKGIVMRTVKGGLIIDIGTTAFLPASQIDLRRVENFDEWIGHEVEGYVIEYTPEKRRIIVSRRKMLEEARESTRQSVLDKISVGQLIEATVKRIVEFGAFVDLGGVDGLIPRSEISWHRNAKPEDYLKMGEALQTKVIEINKDNGKITLSRRLAQPNPWDTAAEKYPVDSTVEGQIVSVTNYGAFIRLEEGLDGMIHVSDMAWDSVGHQPTDYVAVGQEVKASVLSIDSKARRISLGLKQLTKDPWEDIEARYPKGKRLKGQVTGLTKYGAFVELEPGIEGMIHVSDFSWEKRINQPRDVVQKGDEIEVCILEVDRNKRRISLGVKQLSDSPLEMFMSRYSVGDIIEGEVVNVTEFGAFMRVTDGVEGFIHVSQLDRERINHPSDSVKIGETIKAKVSKIDPETGKISLSRRQLLKDQERTNVAPYLRRNDSESLLTMGDLLEDLNLSDDLPSEPAPAAKAPVESAGLAGGDSGNGGLKAEGQETDAAPLLEDSAPAQPEAEPTTPETEAGN